VAQATIPIGSIGIAQIAQPALAALWSFAILGEVLAGWQFVGMGLVIAGLLGFVLLNQRRRTEPPLVSLESTEGSGATV
jgi:drug/metabolite transporter (DMT)-like permease